MYNHHGTEMSLKQWSPQCFETDPQVTRMMNKKGKTPELKLLTSELYEAGPDKNLNKSFYIGF